ncbi:MAG: hypothetical protein Ta2E_09450 [Mycoplasmoidaceae bacterium]|nr:MAG: hypothetical protein Ta2E_09450 [Mycoplasmoidaceae bacterium]
MQAEFEQYGSSGCDLLSCCEKTSVVLGGLQAATKFFYQMILVFLILFAGIVTWFYVSKFGSLIFEVWDTLCYWGRVIYHNTVVTTATIIGFFEDLPSALEDFFVVTIPSFFASIGSSLGDAFASAMDAVFSKLFQASGALLKETLHLASAVGDLISYIEDLPGEIGGGIVDHVKIQNIETFE